ncbi:MAG TPA: aminotransferase class V-fold PLP-dependent enzyme, partial [Atribacterota bacterium]|nr:aminotransferase class V-fold PLP-dependent enzyme [Atribacterota bacterium]
EAARILYQCRENLAELFNTSDPLRIIFTLNATESINLVLKGLLHAGNHVITSSMEHNAVMRPLRELEKCGVQVQIVPCSCDGYLDPLDIEKAIKKNTALIILNHASNVTGTLLPIRSVGAIARKRNILFLVDGAQTAGTYPIDIEKDNIDLLAFTGHKSLFGPTGTGGLVIGEKVDINKIAPLKTGGTGSRSESENHPDFLPDLYESGTSNIVGIAGLKAGIRYILKRGITEIRQQERALTDKLISGLKEIPEVILYGKEGTGNRVAVVSFNTRNQSPSDIGLKLDEEYDIMCRVGLHCSPASHRTIGTFPAGTVRFSLSVFNTEQEIEKAVMAVKNITKIL